MTLKKYLNKIEDFTGRTIVVIGATSGIGLALLTHLENKNAKVILLARNLSKANEIKKSHKNIIEVIEYDQTSTISIDKAIDTLISIHQEFDSIVLNCGVLFNKIILENGYSTTIMTNYVGARYFIDQISPKLNHNVRFVIQGSIAAGLMKKNKKYDLTSRKLTKFGEYNISKGYLEAYFYKLMKENKYPNIEYVLTEPGICATNIIRHMAGPIRFLGKGFLATFFHSTKIASLPLLTGLSKLSKNGDYIIPRGIFTLSGYPKIKDLPLKRRRPYLFE